MVVLIGMNSDGENVGAELGDPDVCSRDIILGTSVVLGPGRLKL